MTPRLNRLALVACVLAGAVCALATPADVDARIREGEALLKKAAIGESGAADRAFAAFDIALQMDPARARARAGRGLALIAQALEAPMAQKLPLARRGCADLDAAVAGAPDDVEVRLMRAANAVQMPLVLKRRAVAESDFTVLLGAARDNQVTMTPETRRSIFFQAAAFALKERRPAAVDLLEEAASISATEPTDEQVQSMLALARRQLTSPSHADRQTPAEGPASRP